MIGPCKQETRLVCAAAHRIVAGSIGSADHNGDGGHSGVGYGVDQLCAVANDSLFFVNPANHEPGYVLQENQRNILLVAQLDELGALAGRFRQEYAVIRKDSYVKAMNIGESGYQGCPVPRLEFVEPRTVD